MKAGQLVWLEGSVDHALKAIQDAPLGLVPVHGPVHASWLNQFEIYFSIVQRKALTPE